MARGRPKGYSPYVDITYEELGDYVGRKSPIKVSKAWWDELIGKSQPVKYTTKAEANSLEEKIEYKLTNLND